MDRSVLHNYLLFFPIKNFIDKTGNITGMLNVYIIVCYNI